MMLENEIEKDYKDRTGKKSPSKLDLRDNPENLFCHFRPFSMPRNEGEDLHSGTGNCFSLGSSHTGSETRHKGGEAGRQCVLSYRHLRQLILISSVHGVFLCVRKTFVL